MAGPWPDDSGALLVRGALLLERLGRSLHQLGLPIRKRHEILCSTAARAWRPAPGCGLPTGGEKGWWLVDFITMTWEELDRPCSERAVDHALACAAHRIEANDDERAVLVHGDVHQWNALETGHRFAIGSPSGDQGLYGRIRVRLRGWCSSGRPPFVRGTPRRTSHT